MAKKQGIDDPFAELYEKEGLLPTEPPKETNTQPTKPTKKNKSRNTKAKVSKTRASKAKESLTLEAINKAFEASITKLQEDKRQPSQTLQNLQETLSTIAQSQEAHTDAIQALQTKLDTLPRVETTEPQEVDLTPILEKLESLQTKLSTIEPPQPTDLSPVLEKIELLQTTLSDRTPSQATDLTPVLDKLNHLQTEQSIAKSRQEKTPNLLNREAIYRADREAQSRNIAQTIGTILSILLLCGMSMMLVKDKTAWLTLGHTGLVVFGVFALRWFQRARIQIERRIADHERQLKRDFQLATTLEPFPVSMDYVLIGVMLVWLVVLFAIGS